MTPLIANAHHLAKDSGASLENDDRIRWQSARTRNGVVAPLPLTEAQAWSEANKRTLLLRMRRGVVTDIRNRRSA